MRLLFSIKTEWQREPMKGWRPPPLSVSAHSPAKFSCRCCHLERRAKKESFLLPSPFLCFYLIYTFFSSLPFSCVATFFYYSGAEVNEKREEWHFASINSCDMFQFSTFTARLRKCQGCPTPFTPKISRQQNSFF